MSVLVEITKEKIVELEKRLKDVPDDSLFKYEKEGLEDALKSYKNRLFVLESDALKQAKADMTIIMQHQKQIDDKYDCRTVKFMFWLADKLDRIGLNSLAKSARNYTVKEINAPVCSITGGPKPELPPMPQHMTSVQREIEEHRRKERAELLKYREIWNNYAEYKPTRWEMFKYRLSLIRRAFSRDLIKGIN